MSFVPIVATIPIVAVLTNHHPNLFERIVRTSVSSMVFCVSGHPKQRPPPFDWSTCSSCCKCFGDDGTLYHSDSTHPLPHVVVVVVNRHRSLHPHRESLATVLSVAQSHTIVHRICLHHVTHVDTSLRTMSRTKSTTTRHLKNLKMPGHFHTCTDKYDRHCYNHNHDHPRSQRHVVVCRCPSGMMIPVLILMMMHHDWKKKKKETNDFHPRTTMP